MSLTFRNMKDMTSYWLDDLNFGYFTETQIGLWLNNAQRRVQKRLLQAGELYYKTDVQTTLVVNQRNYELPADFKKLHYLEIVLSGVVPNEGVQPIQPITENQKYMISTGPGTPQWYVISGTQLILRPAPDTALTVRLGYSYEVADMVNDSDLPDVPESYHELLPLLAAEDGFLKDGRSSEILAKKIKEFTQETDADAQERNQDQPRSIVETGNDASSGFYW